MKKVAIFDIDGTIFRSSLVIEVTEALLTAGIFPASCRKIYLPAKENWRNRQGSYEDYIRAVVLAFEQNIKGVKQSDFLRIVHQVIDRNKDLLYRYTRDLVADLKKRDYFLLAISHSPFELVKEFSENLGFDKIYGRIYEVGPKNKYTSQVLYSQLIDNKYSIVRRALEKENLTLKGSIGVGDTESDLSFLKKVSRPICFNPNKKLYQYAKRADWPIVVERKDVIYKIK